MAAAAVALTVLYIVVERPTQNARSPLVSRSISVVTTTPPIAPDIVWAAEDTAIDRLPAPRTDSSSSRAPSIDNTVLVDEREARAIRKLISGVVNGRIDLAALLNTSPSERAFLEVVPVPESDAPANAWPLPAGTIETGVPQ
jgi:hypothetical protein